MQAAILIAVLVLVVAFLVVGDFIRTERDSSQWSDDRPAIDASPRTLAEAHDGSAFLREPVPAAGHDARPGSISSSGGSHQRSRHGPAAHSGSRRELKNWRVRSRLMLLVIIPSVAVAVVAFCVVRIADATHTASTHPSGSSLRDRAILSAVAFTVVAIVILALALWLAAVAAGSVLRPIRKLRAGALDLDEVRLPDEIRHISGNNGQGVPSSDVEPIDVDSSDEIGEVGRAFNHMRTEMLRLAANETALRGRLDAMFVNLSHRSQSLVERQIRLIEHLEQGEQDSERLANLLKMNRIASRMHRNSQNLLVLAGHEVPSDWTQAIALVNVIRAAVSEVEDYERISLAAQPDIAVNGPAVNDVVHLLAELIENATSFSAGDMQVDISGQVLTSGGVLVDITDRGVGMAPKELAYANWRLEHPPAADINVPKWMGLFVVARLAARHGIRVRLQQADFGGLTALTWLPGEILTDQGAAPPSRLSSFGSAGSRRRLPGPGLPGPGLPGPGLPEPGLPEPGLPEPATDPGYVAAEERVSVARAPEFAPPREDVRHAPPGRRLIPDAGRAAASGPRPVLQTGPPAAVRPFGSGLPEPAGASGQQAYAQGDENPGGTFAAAPLAARAAPWRSETSQSASTPVATEAPSGYAEAPTGYTEAPTGYTEAPTEKSAAAGGVIVPPVEVAAETRRLPIFDAVESNWFRGGREAPSSSSGPNAAAGNRWSSPADQGWNAARTVDSPSSGGETTAGLPRRLPNANLVPGAIPGSEPVLPPRSAAAARDRLAGFQRGVGEARASASETANPGGEDES
jgi:signal transduction histidine kinase